ncbi:MAG TPA: thiamine-phosphate kinase [Alphaproteobacteria bacterium]|nr:thiamine-phosphate kinase [Alphaproteobacteria bacterium]
MSLPGEFDLIRRYFAPLAGPGALSLTDDAAVIEPRPGWSMVATVDTVLSGVHFLPQDPPDLVARKALRVNLSDLAAMGAEPLGYLLVTALPPDTEESWLERFTQGLALDQAEFAISLLGGDTAATPGPLSVTITALGQVEAGRALLRSTARRGDGVYVSGTLGDGAFGLKLAKGGGVRLREGDRAFLLDRYRLPRPRVALGRRLVGIATAAIDLSDGLAADLGHVCEASGLGARIEGPRVPLSDAARAMIAIGEGSVTEAITGGDDYELLFTAPPQAEPALAQIAAKLDLPLTRLGALCKEPGVVALDDAGHTLPLGTGGYRHF